MSAALMFGVFVLSALVGGGAAGLMLALMENDGGGQATASLEGVGIVTPTMPRPASGAAQASRIAADAGTATLPRNASAAAPVATARRNEATAAVKPGGETPAVAMADSAGTADLARLTSQVVAALSAMNGATATEGAEGEAAVERAAAGADRLRQTLAELVATAQAQGRSDEEIRRLLQEALANAGEENIPEILRDASGKVNVHRLLASVMPVRPQDVVPKDSEGLAYFRQLEEEADNSSMQDRAAMPARRGARQAQRTSSRARKAAGRFFIVNGKRYTIIRKGDTLSDIAYAAYGDVLAYPVILRANRGRISVRNLRPGTRILIPDLPRKARRQGEAGRPRPATRRKARAGEGEQRRAARRKAVAQKVVVTMPASSSPNGAASRTRPVKVMNFRSSRDARPLPIVPTAPAN